MENTRVLVVEDEGIVARDIQNMLIGLDYNVVAVSRTSKDAISQARAKKPAIVLMDIMLQGTHAGIEAADAIYKKLNIPVIYLTSYTNEATLELAKKTTPYGYLLKPFEERELLTSIEIALYKFAMEKELKKRERWLFTILESIADAVIATDDKKDITFMNPMAENLTGWKQSTLLGRPLGSIFRAGDEKVRAEISRFFEKDFRRSNKNGFAGEVILNSKAGMKIPVEFRITPIQEKKKQISGIVLAFSDISRRKKAEESLRKSWEKQKKAMQGMVQALGVAIEKRDPYTAGHQRRVTKLALAIAGRLSFPEERMEGLRMAGELHDIGKIHVPAEILSKPGKISEVEFSIIKSHPQMGYDILKSIDFPWPVHEFVYQHHERMNGSGYPLGLKGEKIHLEARILAVSDVIEAMASHRPYRPALSLEQALDEIEKNRGILYDPKVVDACLAVFKEEHFTFD